MKNARCSAEDIKCVISENDFHIFYRKGNKIGGKRVNKFPKFGTFDNQDFSSNLDSGMKVFPGLSKNYFHWLLWTVE